MKRTYPPLNSRPYSLFSKLNPLSGDQTHSSQKDFPRNRKNTYTCVSSKDTGPVRTVFRMRLTKTHDQRSQSSKASTSHKSATTIAKITGRCTTGAQRASQSRDASYLPQTGVEKPQTRLKKRRKTGARKPIGRTTTAVPNRSAPGASDRPGESLSARSRRRIRQQRRCASASEKKTSLRIG